MRLYCVILENLAGEFVVIDFSFALIIQVENKFTERNGNEIWKCPNFHKELSSFLMELKIFSIKSFINSGIFSLLSKVFNTSKRALGWIFLFNLEFCDLLSNLER